MTYLWGDLLISEFQADICDTLLWAENAYKSGRLLSPAYYYPYVIPFGGQLLMLPFIPVFGEESGSFSALLVCFIPRILIGVVSGLLFAALSKTKLKSALSAGICGFVGSLTNTVFVMGGIVLFFGKSYSAARNEAYEALIGTVMATITGVGITEAIVSALKETLPD